MPPGLFIGVVGSVLKHDKILKISCTNRPVKKIQTDTRTRSDTGDMVCILALVGKFKK